MTIGFTYALFVFMIRKAKKKQFSFFFFLFLFWLFYVNFIMFHELQKKCAGVSCFIISFSGFFHSKNHENYFLFYFCLFLFFYYFFLHFQLLQKLKTFFESNKNNKLKLNVSFKIWNMWKKYIFVPSMCNKLMVYFFRPFHYFSIHVYVYLAVNPFWQNVQTYYLPFYGRLIWLCSAFLFLYMFL